MTSPDYPYGYIRSPQSEPETEQPMTQQNEGYVSVADLDSIIAEKLAERDRQHAEEMAAFKSSLPQAQVAANAGGPGNDRHQRSWSLVEQEHAARGETLDHWE